MDVFVSGGGSFGPELSRGEEQSHGEWYRGLVAWKDFF